MTSHRRFTLFASFEDTATMTNQLTVLENKSAAIVCQPTTGDWVFISGWIPLIIVLIALLYLFTIQCCLVIRPQFSPTSSQQVAERRATLGVVFGCVAFMIGTGMTLYGLLSTGATFSKLSLPIEHGHLECYLVNLIPGFTGVLLWSFAFAQQSVFRFVWQKRKDNAQPAT